MPSGGTTVPTMTETTQVYKVFIKATPEAIWDAITNPDQTDRYGYRGRAHYDLRPGGSYQAHASAEMRAMGTPEIMVEGEVIESQATRKLVQTWHPLFGEELIAEPAGRVTWEIEDADFGGQKVTLTHKLDGAPLAATMVSGSIPGQGGGWAFILSDLKSLLETGSSISDPS
jgi:uncharacterized protein YndB with AHSA1/START domain